MVAGQSNTIRVLSGSLRYHDLDGLAEQIRAWQPPHWVVVDLADADKATTAGLARLVVLRGRLLRAGGDLRLSHLHGQPRRLYEINRLDGVLPCEDQPQASPSPSPTRN